MIKSVKFENYKSFKEFELDDMTQIVLLSGRNNTGKSSILEGLFLFYDHRAPDSFFKSNRFRGLNQTSINTIWENNFRDFNIENEIKITVFEDKKLYKLKYSMDKLFVPSDTAGTPGMVNQFISAAKKNYSLKYELMQNSYQEIGHFTVSETGILANTTTKDNKPLTEMKHAQFINYITANNDLSINDWFSKIELKGKKQDVVEILKIIEPAITDIRTISLGGQPNLYADIAGKLIPLKLCGDGINRLLYIICSIMENADSILLIDEIEIGFHYSVYPQIWNLIAKAAKHNNSQLIISTHSFECIASAIKGVKEAEMCSEFTYYRLERNGNTQAKRFSYEMLRNAIDANMEVR